MVRAAIIGLGKVAENIHIPACRAVEQIELVAACDVRGERARAIGEKFKIARIYEDAEEMLRKESPDLVIVGTPPDSHRHMTLLSLRGGADVLCEKPFMLSVDEADEVIEEAQRLGRSVAVNTQYRYMQTYRAAHQNITSNVHGKLYLIQCWQQMFHPPVYEGPESWRSQLKQSTLYEFGSHPLDLICHFMGALPEAIVCFTPQVCEEFNSDVLVQMTLRFPGERLATLALNRVSNAPERYLEMRLDCEKASLRVSLGGVARASFEITRFSGRNHPSLRISLVRGGEARVEQGGESRTIAVEPKPAFSSATAANIRALLQTRTRPSYHGVELARDILRIIFAGYESARTGKVIEFAKFDRQLVSR